MEIGKQSIRLEKPVYVESWASVVGKKEGEGPLAPFFDEIETDDQLGQDNWEEAESMLQQKAARLAIKKAGCCPEDIRIIFAGDLLAQSIASSFGIGELERPMYGVFGACSTMGEALSLGAITVSAGHGERVLAVTSSHFATAEKEFRFPLGYGNQRPLSASWTVTGSGACVLNRKKGRVKITGLTIGKVVDYGLKDSQNMGACMAPAACSTIVQNLKDFGRKPEEYESDYYRRSWLYRTADITGPFGKRRVSGREKSQRLWNFDTIRKHRIPMREEAAVAAVLLYLPVISCQRLPAVTGNGYFLCQQGR